MFCQKNTLEKKPFNQLDSNPFPPVASLASKCHIFAKKKKTKKTKKTHTHTSFSFLFIILKKSYFSHYY
jgi:hypothetical protein